MLALLAFCGLDSCSVNPQVVGSSPTGGAKKCRVASATLHFLFVPYVGLEPIYMQVSGGHLLTPVQKLGPTSILSFFWGYCLILLSKTPDIYKMLRSAELSRQA